MADLNYNQEIYTDLEGENDNFLTRLVNEQNELNKKISKLNNFTETLLFTKLPPVQKSCLLIQLKAMETYSECLKQRLAFL